jgi:hypothetical protein
MLNAARRWGATAAVLLVGGSIYRFTLNAVRGNPRGARIILLFAAGTAA